MSTRSGTQYIGEMEEGTVLTGPVARAIIKEYNKTGRKLTKEETAKIVNQHKRKITK